MENQELTQNNSAYAIGEKTNGKGNDGLNSPAKSSAETTNAKNVAAKPAQKKKKSNDEFRRKYFDYYDDVKDRTKGKEDW